MKALSLWQPWASLIAYGLKRVETRSWDTNYRGPLAIHAAKTTRGLEEFAAPESLRRRFLESAGVDRLDELPLGCIVAVADLYAVERMTAAMVADVPHDEYLLGAWTEGRYAWRFGEVRRLERPVPYRGAQGLFGVGGDELLTECERSGLDVRRLWTISAGEHRSGEAALGEGRSGP